MKEEDMNHLRQQDRNLRDALRQEEAELPQMPADLNARVMQRVGDEQPKHSCTMWRWMAAAACLLLIIGIGYALLPKEQQDEPLVAQKTVCPIPEDRPQAEPEPQADPEPQVEEPQQKVAEAEVQPSQKPAKEQRRVVVKLVELIPDSEAESTNMKTLPASLIAKVKAYDKQSDLSRTTGIVETDPLMVMTVQVDETDPLVAMAAQVDDIRQRGQRLQEEIRQQMKN